MDPKLTLTFLKPGLQTTIQDKGRLGYQYLGIPIGGALDQNSAKMANFLVSNDENEPVFEITLTGPEILFDSDALIAITGANFAVYSDGVLIDNNKAYYLTSGSIISFGKLKAGSRAYLAVAGKWNVQKWKNSASPLLQSPEATADSFIKKGSKISIDSHYLNKTESWDKNKTPPVLSNKIRVKVKAGPDFENISRMTIAEFFSQGHTISNDSNRMGYRLESKLTKAEERDELISSGIIPGTIQLTQSGQAIILLNDAQTTGGYPRIANIEEDDLDSVAQLKPGDEIWFSLV